MEKNIAVDSKNACLHTKSSDLKIIPVITENRIIPSKRKIKEMTVEDYSHAMQKLVKSNIVVREKCIKIISRSTGVQIGWRIKKEYEDGSKSNEPKYFK